MTGAPLFLGIDVGTQGARAVLADTAGHVIAHSAQHLAVLPSGPEQEQQPDDWWRAVVGVVHDLGDLRARVTSLAISCTSGTLCAVDADGAALMPALLYSDRRAVPAPGSDSSWAVAKLRWLVAERPDVAARTARFTSPGGYLTGRLMGALTAIDDTQALKFGYDHEREGWGALPVTPEQLPPVVATGTPLGSISGDAAATTGLPADTVVVAGATDGITAQLACHPAPDRWATAIGSTIVWKTMSPTRIASPAHGIYSHRAPDGWWFPGAASNAGARILSTWAADEELDTLATSADITLSTAAAYPSVIRGERFPFVDPGFTPWKADALPPPERYASEVLGIAFVERWGCEVLVEHGCTPPAVIATTGGIVAARAVTQLRADVLQVPLEVPAEPHSAFGAAVIAAAHAHGGVLAASEDMVRCAERIEPRTANAAEWTRAYQRFRDHCAQRDEGAA